MKKPRAGPPRGGSEVKPMPLLGGFQIFGARLSSPFVSHKLEGDLLSLIKAVHAGAFHRAYMHEHVFCAVFRLNKTKALLAVKPLYGSRRHGSPFSRYICR